MRQQWGALLSAKTDSASSKQHNVSPDMRDGVVPVTCGDLQNKDRGKAISLPPEVLYTYSPTHPLHICNPPSVHTCCPTPTHLLSTPAHLLSCPCTPVFPPLHICCHTLTTCCPTPAHLLSYPCTPAIPSLHTCHPTPAHLLSHPCTPAVPSPVHLLSHPLHTYSPSPAHLLSCPLHTCSPPLHTCSPPSPHPCCPPPEEHTPLATAVSQGICSKTDESSHSLIRVQNTPMFKSHWDLGDVSYPV